MNKVPLNLRDQGLCLGLAMVLVGPLRDVAAAHGYALGEHGSRRRDIDLIAVPWTSEAVDPIVLAEAIRAKAEELVGVAFPTALENTEYFWRGSPGAKPHGRLTFSYQLGGGPYIDLSVMTPWRDCGPTLVLPTWAEGEAPRSAAELAAMDPIPPMVPWVPTDPRPAVPHI